ncbi:Ig-like domain-containing protein [Paenibacillus guangzhouensis]|uniref:Ig-like domain-containing protein n=1 Tax=Paenibacillus guangzhouensis TaxID=1473112 RepID=UPI00187B3CED|nr:Ig-like domain-containing protein [Paenibacillus guangzhouensis]
MATTKKKIFSLMIACCMISTSLFVPTFHAQAAANEEVHSLNRIQAQFFVSPNGNDKNDGSYDKPFATVQAARDAVRAINKNMTGDIYVFIAKGKYYLDQTITFNEQDSGTNGYHIIYRNLDDLASAEMIGGKVVDTPWQIVERTGADADLPAAAAGKVYKTHVGTDVIFDTLYVNDRRATLARTQNLNRYKDFPAALTPYMRSAGGGIGDLIYRAGDLDQESINGLVNAEQRGDLDASVYMWDGGYWDWMTDTIPVSSINTATRQLVYKKVPGKPEMYRPKYNTGTDARYFVQGNLGFLDVPGEYYFNKTTGDLYYYPEGDMNDKEFIIPTVKEVIRVEGSDRTHMVSNIEFSGLQLKDTNTTDWYAYGWNWGDAGAGLGFYPPEAKGSTQPSYAEQTERIEFQYGVVTLTNTKNVTISKTHIKNSGMFGIELYLANENATIKDNLIEYTGHGGINVDGGYPGVAGDKNGDGYSRNNTITNTIVHDIGELIGQASGITIQQSSYNTVSHVEVYNSPRRGLFLTAGYSRNPNAAFPDGDKNFNIMTDMYTHHNKIEYVYLHDAQQDGGDDGAFFACYLYKGANYKPNYLNQVIIDNTGANPTMTDFGPNDMNLDMGASGLELSNVKATNPMNFNIEVNTILQYGDVIKFDNTNVNYGKLANHIKEFDDSKMEYDKIGVTSDYPTQYLTDRDLITEPADIYFKENFEHGLDDTVWSVQDGQAKISTEFMSERPINGKQSLELMDKTRVFKNFPEMLNKVVTVKMFDRQNYNLAAYDSGQQNSARVTSIARVDDGENVIGLGSDFDTKNNYIIQIGNQKETTNIPRTFGWHELKFDYTSGSEVGLYIDHQLVKTVPAAGFDYVSFGADNGRGQAFYDELYVFGGKPATLPIPPSNIPAPPAYDGSDVNKQQLKLDFEDGIAPQFTKIGGMPSVTSVVYESGNSGNQVLKDEIRDGNDFYELNAPWNNYLVNMKWRFEGWGTTDVLGGAYDNFTIYVMTSTAGIAPGKAPLSYQVVYRRNKNGTSGYAAGTPYFEISKHTASSDTSLGKVGLPNGFNANEWHNLQIQTFDGKIGFVLDGQKLISVDDGQYKSGGVGFGGINATVNLDDIEIISNPKYVDYAADLGLGNAVLNGNFNPNYYTYYATIVDTAQPITVQKPHIVLDGVEIRLQLNGEEILFEGEQASISPDKLVKGKNTLVLSEISSAGSKDYTIYMNKDYQITSIEGIEENVSTTLDHAPNLPREVTVTFQDGVSQVAKVNWDTINPSRYKQPGSFTVKGQLVDLKGTVSVHVTVDGVTSIDKLGHVTTLAGVAPVLAATVHAQDLNGPRELPLTFAQFDPSLYAHEGTIIAVGAAEGYAGDILQVVEVQDNYNPKPILTAGTASRLTETTASVSFGTSKDGQYYYQVVESGAKAPVIDTSKAGAPAKKGLVLIGVEGLKKETAKDIYMVVKNGNVVSDVLKMEIPKYTVDSGYTLAIGKETAGGAGYTRNITIAGDKGNDLTGKYLTVQFTEGTGVNAKVSVVMIAPHKNEVTISYQKQGTKIEAWLTSGLPNLMGENIGVEVFASAKSN